MLLSRLLHVLAVVVYGVRALSPHYVSFRSLRDSIDNTFESRDINLGENNNVPRTLDDDDKDHQYVFKEFAPQPNGHGSNEQPYYRILLLFKKKPDVTEEYFNKHWKTVHADLTMTGKNIGVQVSRYVQFHSGSAYRAELTPLINLGQGLILVAAYDGIAEFHAPSFDSFYKFMAAVLADPAQNGDMTKFVDVSSGLEVMAGHDNLIFGNTIKSSGGTDGILANDKRLVYEGKGNGHGHGKGDDHGGKGH